MSFIDYLTTVRMQKAVELLGTRMKVGEIAKKVGYQSRNRFFITDRWSQWKSTRSHRPSGFPVPARRIRRRSARGPDRRHLTEVSSNPYQEIFLVSDDGNILFGDCRLPGRLLPGGTDWRR